MALLATTARNAIHGHQSLAYAAASEKTSTAPRISTGQALASHEGKVIEWRSRDAVRNDPSSRRGQFLYRNGARGPLKPRSSIAEANQAFDRWARLVGFRHQAFTFSQLFGVALNELIQTGRVFIQRIQSDPIASSGRHPNGLLLQVWPSSAIDMSKGQLGQEYESGAVYGGTWFRGETADVSSRLTTTSLQSQFVDARDLIELRMISTAGAVGGEPVFSASIVQAKLTHRLALADLARAEVENGLVAVALIHKQPIRAGFPSVDINRDQNNVEQPIQKGRIGVVHGDDLKFAPRTAIQSALPIHTARAAAAINLDAVSLSGDIQGASFSGLNMAVQRERQAVIGFARDCGIFTARDRLLEWWLEREALVHDVNWFDGDWTWIPETPIVLNRSQQANAEAQQIANGTLSRETAMLENGRDPDIETARMKSEPGIANRKLKLVTSHV